MFKLWRGCLGCLLAACITAGSAAAQSPAPVTAATGSTAVSENLRRDIEAAREKVYPALVNISVVVRYYAEGHAQRTLAGGSGVIVSKDGYVLTNFHVAGHTTRITCTLPTGEAMSATTVTDDPLTDISVLKLNLEERANPAAPLPFAVLGDSDALNVGDYVLAMGNPLMLSSSMTLGIVSNTHRVFTDFTGSQIEDVELETGERTGLLTRWIQHDALILPGNSGGPLVNLQGQVVGINELGGGGVGFAIPSNIAARVLDSALHGGKIQRGWLGVSVLPVNKLNRKTGALVASVLPSSPAQKAGLRPGDILLSLAGRPVNVQYFEEAPLFYQQAAALQPGTNAAVKFLRDGKEQTTSLAVEPMQPYLGKEDEIRDLGVTLEEITEPMALARRYPNKDGVLATSVRPGYPFEAAHPPIQDGDVILAVNGTPTLSIDALRAATSAVGKKPFVVTLRRGDEQLLTVVTPKQDESADAGDELPHAWIGVKTQVMTPEIAAAIKLQGTRGFRVTEVYPWTEASKAGVRVGDVITAVNGQKLTASRPQDAEELRRLIEDLTVGDKATLSILRAGAPEKVSVVLEPTPASAAQAKKAHQDEFEFTVREVTPMDRFTHKWSKDQQGVMVVDVTAGSWANIAGLQADDLITAINQQEVTDVASFQSVMKTIVQQKPKTVEMFVRRGYSTYFVFIEPVWKAAGGEG